MLRSTLSTAFALLLATGAAAQSVTVAIVASTVSASCSWLGQTAQQALPAGPIAWQYEAEAELPPTTTGVHSLATGYVIAQPQQITFVAWNREWNSLPGSLTQTEHDVTLQLTATAPTPVTLGVDSFLALTAGAPAPLMEVDVGDDGQLDWNLSLGSAWAGSFVLTPQPLAVRVRLRSQLTGSLQFADIESQVMVRVEPDNRIRTTLEAVGCLGAALERPQPIFDGFGVALTGQPSLLVFGFATQPTLLGPQSPVPFLPGMSVDADP